MFISHKAKEQFYAWKAKQPPMVRFKKHARNIGMEYTYTSVAEISPDQIDQVHPSHRQIFQAWLSREDQRDHTF